MDQKVLEPSLKSGNQRSRVNRLGLPLEEAQPTFFNSNAVSINEFGQSPLFDYNYNVFLMGGA
jgi:hypothetical protein